MVLTPPFAYEERSLRHRFREQRSLPRCTRESSGHSAWVSGPIDQRRLQPKVCLQWQEYGSGTYVANNISEAQSRTPKLFKVHNPGHRVHSSWPTRAHNTHPRLKMSRPARKCSKNQRLHAVQHIEPQPSRRSPVDILWLSATSSCYNGWIRAHRF